MVTLPELDDKTILLIDPKGRWHQIRSVDRVSVRVAIEKHFQDQGYTIVDPKTREERLNPPRLRVPLGRMRRALPKK